MAGRAGTLTNLPLSCPRPHPAGVHGVFGAGAQDLESLFPKIFVHSLQRIIVGCKSASCRRIDDEQDLSRVLAEVHFVPFSVLYCEIIDVCHSFLLLVKILPRLPQSFRYIYFA